MYSHYHSIKTLFKVPFPPTPPLHERLTGYQCRPDGFRLAAFRGREDFRPSEEANSRQPRSGAVRSRLAEPRRKLDRIAALFAFPDRYRTAPGRPAELPAALLPLWVLRR